MHKQGKNVALKSLQKTVGPSIALIVAKDMDNKEASKEDNDADKVTFSIRMITSVYSKGPKVKKRHIQKKDK